MVALKAVLALSLLSPSQFWTGQTPPRLRLVMYDVTGMAPFAFEAVASQLQSLFGDLGVRVEWRQADGTGMTADGHEVRVIFTDAHPRSVARDRWTMGMTVRAKDVQTCLWVFPSRVTATLGLDIRHAPEWSVEERKAVAAAVARVVAHELTHALAPTLQHAGHGLLMQVLGPSQLVTSRFELSDRARQSVLAGLQTIESVQIDVPDPAGMSRLAQSLQ